MASYSKIRLPWFRVHIVILNDPGRLISVHIMHSGLCGGWGGLIVLYEVITFDPRDPVFNPIWRQGCYVIPCSVRLGVISSIYHWSLSQQVGFISQSNLDSSVITINWGNEEDAIILLCVYASIEP